MAYISTVGEYSHVTNMVGNVIINGQIMPWRLNNETPQSTIQKSACLRGEDICFLYEKKDRMAKARRQSNSILAYSP